MRWIPGLSICTRAGPQPDDAQVSPRRDRGLAQLEPQVQPEAVSGPHGSRAVDAPSPVPAVPLDDVDAGEVMDVRASGEAAGQKHRFDTLSALG